MPGPADWTHPGFLFFLSAASLTSFSISSTPPVINPSFSRFPNDFILKIISAASLAFTWCHHMIRMSLLLPVLSTNSDWSWFAPIVQPGRQHYRAFLCCEIITIETERNSLLPSVNSYHRSFCDQHLNCCYYSDVIHTANVMFYEREFPIERIFYPPLCGFFVPKRDWSHLYLWQSALCMKPEGTKVSPKDCPRFISLAARAFLRK